MHDDDRIAFDDSTLRLVEYEDGIRIVDTHDSELDIYLVEWIALDNLIAALTEIREACVQNGVTE